MNNTNAPYKNNRESADVGDSLTKRAVLTNINGLIAQICRFVAGFFISPVIIRTLGVELFGAWSMISQLLGYFALSDMRSSGTLKVLIMLVQHKDSTDEKRRLVGAAAGIWVISFFMLIAAGLAILPFTASLIRTKPEYGTAVKLALAISLFDLSASQLFSIPGNILRGSNLDYKSMGLRSVLSLTASFLGLVVVKAGWGIAGLAFAGILGTCLTGLLWIYLAKRYVNWFGIAKPMRMDMKLFTETSFWFLIISLGQVILFTSDILLVGFLLGPSTAGAYATTGVLVRLLIVPVTTLIASTTAGLVGICGKQEWARMASITRQITSVFVVLGISVGAVVLTLNHAFLSKWVGDGFFVGQALTLVLVLLSIAQCMFRIESMVVDGLQAFRKKAYILMYSGGFSLLAGYLLSLLFGSLGIAVAMLSGCLLATGNMSRLIREKTAISYKDRFGNLFRPLVIGSILLVTAYFLMLPARQWPMIIGFAVVVGAVVLGVMIRLGLLHDDRLLVWNRLVSQFPNTARL